MFDSFTPDIYRKMLAICSEMRSEGHSREFVRKTLLFSIEYEGAYDLMVLWSEETDEEERSLIIKDLEELEAEDPK